MRVRLMVNHREVDECKCQSPGSRHWSMDGVVSTLGRAPVDADSFSVKLDAPPGAGIPPEVACPHCGGYVRGHQWIGADSCSITDRWPDVGYRA
jgi:hypothetical protein